MALGRADIDAIFLRGGELVFRGCSDANRAIAFIKIGWDQLVSSAGPPCRKQREIRVGWRGEAPLVPP